MARTLVDASQRLTGGSACGTDFGTGDFSWFAWVKTGAADVKVAISKDGGANAWLGIYIGAPATFAIGSTVISEASNTLNDGNWHLLGGTRVSGTARLYVDANDRGSASAGDDLGTGDFNVGYFVATFGWDGDVGPVFCYSAGLSAAEVAALAKGFSPLLVRPQSLVNYFPLLGNNSPEPDVRQGFSLTLTGSCTKAPHPRVIYPRRRQAYSVAAAAGGVFAPYYYREHIARYAG